MSELRLEQVAINAAPLGPGHVLVPLASSSANQDYEIDDSVPQAERRFVNYGHPATHLPYTVLGDYGRDCAPLPFNMAVLENEHLCARFVLDFGGRLRPRADSARCRPVRTRTCRQRFRLRPVIIAAMLTQPQIDFYHDNGYLHLPEIFTPDETRDLQNDMDWMVEQWATVSSGWTGPWRQALMDEQTEEKSKLIHMHKLHYYCASWMRATVHPPLVETLAQLLGDCVELHDTTMHVKPPQTGHPFPMHQDHPFYPHADDRYVDVLVHLDDTCHENGEIRFLAGSHKAGPLPHVTKFDDGTECTPPLPTDQYKLADTVAVPAKAGDCVLFNINTIHGSHINQTDVPRRIVRIGYRHPDNEQFAGDSFARPDVIVHGRRRRVEGQPQYSPAAPADDLEYRRQKDAVTG